MGIESWSYGWWAESLRFSILAALLFVSPNSQSQTIQPREGNDGTCAYFGSTPETRGKLVTPPVVVHTVRPRYPSALASQTDGLVLLCVTISRDGTVAGVYAMSGATELIQPAVTAVAQWRFRPFLANGQPVEASIRVLINFRSKTIRVIST